MITYSLKNSVYNFETNGLWCSGNISTIKHRLFKMEAQNWNSMRQRNMKSTIWEQILNNLSISKWKYVQVSNSIHLIWVWVFAVVWGLKEPILCARCTWIGKLLEWGLGKEPCMFCSCFIKFYYNSFVYNFVYWIRVKLRHIMISAIVWLNIAPVWIGIDTLHKPSMDFLTLCKLCQVFWPQVDLLCQYG